MATASAPHESSYPQGRPGNGAAAARTEQLFAEHGRTVNVLCRALLRDRAEAEDAAQQTFLSAHRALLSGTTPREPAAWLAAIARNECWARIRTRMREPLATVELETVAAASDPLAEAIRRADLAALWHAIEELPRQQRDALLLREFGGLSYGELAAALAVSGAAVESLLFRARHRLRGRLRAAYASLAGASWIDTLMRLGAGGGAPVAAKVAALGVGAAAIGGSAFVVPQAFDNHRPSQGPPERTPAAVVHRRTAPVIVEPAVAPRAAPIQVVAVASHRQESDHRGKHVQAASSGNGDGGGGQHAGQPRSVGQRGEGQDGSADGGSGQSGSGGVDSGRDGIGNGVNAGGDGSSGEDGGDGGGGGAGGDGGDGGN